MPSPILKSHIDAITVSSEITSETRMKDLEVTVGSMSGSISEILKMMKNSTGHNRESGAAIAPATPSGESRRLV